MNERPLTQLEQQILEFIEQHPGLTPFDIAENFDHEKKTYEAIYYLLASCRVNCDPETSAFSVRP